MTAISRFFPPLCTTSNRALMASDSVVITLHEFLAVVLFQELPDSLCIPSDSVRLPLVVSSAGVGLVQTRGAVVIKPGNKTGNAERSSSVALGVPLFEAGDVPGDIFQCDRVLHGQLVGLELNPGLVNENPGVCGQPGEGHNHVVVQQTDLPDRPVLLELCHSLLLHTQDYHIRTSHADSSGTFLDSLLGVLNLEKVAIRGENCDCSVVS